MANIIDASIFVGEIEIPNVNQPEIEVDVNDSIARYEKEVLVALLGSTLYKELRDHTIVAGDKFDKLINGDDTDFEFVFEGVTYTHEWEGLKQLIAYYVYYRHREKRASYFAGVGIEVEADTENSVKTSVYHKMVDIWNKFIDLYGYVEEPGYNLSSYFYENGLPSAYNYLLAKKADFPTWRYTDMGGYLNRFGI